MKLFVWAAALIALAPASYAATVFCTVTSGTVLTATSGGFAYSILNGSGTANGGGTGTISCPSVSTGVGFITSYQVLATADYQGGPFGTTTGTEVTQAFTLVGGDLDGATETVQISGGANSTTSTLPLPFQIGSTLSGATSYAAFTVNVNSAVTQGGPVAGSSGQVVISYEISTSEVPEPAAYSLMGLGLLGLGYFSRRRK